VFGNFGSMLARRTGASDASRIAEQIGLGGADALLDLPNHTGCARLLANACRPRRYGSISMTLRSPAGPMPSD